MKIRKNAIINYNNKQKINLKLLMIRQKILKNQNN